MTSSVSGQLKTTFKFNEVTSMTGVKPYVLRFWESEFDQINPKTNEIGQKLYGPLDIEVVEKVKKLLFEDKLSIPQAKGYLDRETPDYDSHDEANSGDGDAEVNSFEQMSIKSRSLDLKKALEQIIEKNSVAYSQENIHGPANEVASEIETSELPTSSENIVEVVREKIGNQRHLLDKDVVNLVSAKKKLSVLTARIDEICMRNDWH